MNLRSIRFRIVAAFIMALVALLSAQGFLVWQNQAITRSLSVISDGYLPLSRIITQVDRDRERVETDIERVLNNSPRPGTGPSSQAVIYTQQLSENLEIGRIQALGAQRSSSSPEEKAVFNKVLTQLTRIDELFQDYERAATELLVLAEDGADEQAAAKAAAISHIGRELGDEVDKLDRMVNTRIRTLTESTERAQSRANAVAGGLTMLALAFSIFLVAAVLIALRPIGRLTEQVQRLAAGDYSMRVEVRGDDEIAILAKEFNAMVEALELRDRTLVERAEELNRLSLYLRSVLDSLVDGLFVVEGGQVSLANPASERLWGAAAKGEPPNLVAAMLAEPGRHELKGPQGGLHELRVTPFGADGVVVVTTDVTEQTRAKEQLHRGERLALVGQMLAQITHEVRNPLNSMSLNADMLQDELADLDPSRETEAWELHALISKEIGRLTELTGHYLQLARRPPARLEAHDLGVVIAEVVRLLEPEIEAAGAQLTVIDGQLSAQLVDGNQLRQALLNVLRNAIEAGAKTLKLSLEADEAEVRIALADDGPGMSAEEIDRATDPFFSTKAKGTGLGLAITGQILEDHDGSLLVHSSPGEGTRIIMVLPQRPTSLDTESALAADHSGRG